MPSADRGGFQRPIYLRSADPGGMILLLVVVHVGAMVCVFGADLAVFVKAGLWTATIASLIVGVSGVLARADMQVVLSARGDWSLIDATGESRTVEPVSGQVLHTGLILMTFRDERGRLFPFIFTVGATDRDSLRRLRVRLKYELNV